MFSKRQTVVIWKRLPAGCSIAGHKAVLDHGSRQKDSLNTGFAESADLFPSAILLLPHFGRAYYIKKKLLMASHKQETSVLSLRINCRKPSLRKCPNISFFATRFGISKKQPGR